MAEKQPESKQADGTSRVYHSAYDRLMAKPIFDKMTRDEFRILRDVDSSGLTFAERDRYYSEEEGCTSAVFHVWAPEENHGIFPAGYDRLIEFRAVDIDNAIAIARETLNLEPSYILTDGYGTGYRFSNADGDTLKFPLTPELLAELTDSDMPSELRPVSAKQSPSPGDLAEGKGVEQQKAGQPQQPRLSNGIKL